MASWDTPVVNAPSTASYGAPVQDFSSVANLLQDFVKGRQAGREEEKAQVFRNGIPKDAAGNIDVGAVTERLAKINPDYAMPLINMQMQGQMGQQAASAITGTPGAAQPAAPQQASAPPQSQPRAAQPATRSPQGDQPGSIISMIPDGVSADDTGRIASQVANTFKLDPNAAPPPEMVGRIRAKIASLTGQPVGVGPQPVSTAPEPAPAPQTVAQAGPAPATPQATDAQRLDAEATFIRSRAAALSAVNPKAAEVLNKEADTRADKAKQLRDQAADAPAIKEWRQSGSKLSYDEWVAEAEAEKATAVERAKANVKEQQEYIDAGKAASNRLTTLNAITNVAATDKNVSFGFGADTELKIKMGLERLGFNFGDLSGSQLIQKMNASLASDMAKTLTGRPTQFEFKTFLANNPGLLLDKTGTLRLASIFSQLSKREYEIGKLARQNGDNWQNWDSVVEKYDAQKDHQIIDPVSKQPISTNSIVAPGPAKTEAPHAAVIASKADYDKLPSGATFTSPDGKPWRKP